MEAIRMKLGLWLIDAGMFLLPLMGKHWFMERMCQDFTRRTMAERLKAQRVRR